MSDKWSIGVIKKALMVVDLSRGILSEIQGIDLTLCSTLHRELEKPGREETLGEFNSGKTVPSKEKEHRRTGGEGFISHKIISLTRAPSLEIHWRSGLVSIM